MSGVVVRSQATAVLPPALSLSCRVASKVPQGAHTITLTIGPAAMQVMASAKGRFAKPVTVVFERPAGT